MALSPREMREVFENTEVVRRPTYGIVSGYHELPYICLGKCIEPERGATTEVRGRIQVSPRFILRPPQYEPNYGEIFGEEHVDVALAGRVFGFLGFRSRPVECKSEHLQVTHLSMSMDQAVASALDELERREDITTGLLITPNARYYPVSIERFISSVIEDEFSV